MVAAGTTCMQPFAHRRQPRCCQSALRADFASATSPMAPGSRTDHRWPVQTHSAPVSSTKRGKILVFTLDALGGPERATYPPTSSVGQAYREGVGKRTSELHHVLTLAPELPLAVADAHLEDPQTFRSSV